MFSHLSLYILAGWLAVSGLAKAAYSLGRRAERKAAAELKKIESKL